MIAVDTNLIAYLFLESDRTEQAKRTLAADPEWAAPFLWRSEFRNVLALYQRRGILTLRDALRIISQSEAFMEGREYPVASSNVLALAGLPAALPTTVSLSLWRKI